MTTALPLPEPVPPQRPISSLHFSRLFTDMLRDEHPLPIAAFRQDRAAQLSVEGYAIARRAEVRR